MTRIAIATLAALTAAMTTAHAIPAVGGLDIDFRDSSWNPAGASSHSVGDITAAGSVNTILFGIQPAALSWSATDGLGVSPLGIEPEIGLLEILTVTFANGAADGALGAWVTKLFTGEGILGNQTEKGVVKLYDGATELATIGFQGQVNGPGLGDVYVDFGGAFNPTKAVFYTEGRVSDYSVAGLHLAPGQGPQVPDAGPTLGTLVMGLLTLAAMRRRLA